MEEDSNSRDGGTAAPRQHGWLGRRRRSVTSASARRLYEAIVVQARHPVFYESYHVPDTPDGRYDMILLHAVLVFRRLQRDPGSAELAQALFDIMFTDFDESLREMGVGDLRVGKQVKAMARGLYGRIAAYGPCLDAADAAGLAAALDRNVYRHRPADPARLADLARYVAGEDARLAAAPLAGLAEGRLAFTPPLGD